MCIPQSSGLKAFPESQQAQLGGLQQQQQPACGAPPSMSAPPNPFTPTQRSLQARNKAFDASAAAAETYEQRQKRDEAHAVLQDVQALMWHAVARNEVRLPLLPSRSPLRLK